MGTGSTFSPEANEIQDYTENLSISLNVVLIRSHKTIIFGSLAEVICSRQVITCYAY